MAVGEATTEFKVVPGVRLASVSCGIKAGDDLDLVLFEFTPGSVTTGIFTTNHFAAAPVHLARQHLVQRRSKYFLINSGNANAATGQAGVADALTCCKAVSQQTGALPEEVVPFSTGVIGERLQVAQILGALADLTSGLDQDNWLLAAKGIMTTDTRPKIASRQFDLEGKPVTITGIAKGAGMIQPNMAICEQGTSANTSRSLARNALSILSTGGHCARLILFFCQNMGIPLRLFAWT